MRLWLMSDLRLETDDQIDTLETLETLEAFAEQLSPTTARRNRAERRARARDSSGDNEGLVAENNSVRTLSENNETMSSDTTTGDGAAATAATAAATYNPDEPRSGGARTGDELNATMITLPKHLRGTLGSESFAKNTKLATTYTGTKLCIAGDKMTDTATDTISPEAADAFLTNTMASKAVSEHFQKYDMMWVIEMPGFTPVEGTGVDDYKARWDTSDKKSVITHFHEITYKAVRQRQRDIKTFAHAFEVTSDHWIDDYMKKAADPELAKKVATELSSLPAIEQGGLIRTYLTFKYADGMTGNKLKALKTNLTEFGEKGPEVFGHRNPDQARVLIQGLIQVLEAYDELQREMPHEIMKGFMKYNNANYQDTLSDLNREVREAHQSADLQATPDSSAIKESIRKILAKVKAAYQGEKDANNWNIPGPHAGYRAQDGGTPTEIICDNCRNLDAQGNPVPAHTSVDCKFGRNQQREAHNRKIRAGKSKQEPWTLQGSSGRGGRGNRNGGGRGPRNDRRRNDRRGGGGGAGREYNRSGAWLGSSTTYGGQQPHSPPTSNDFPNQGVATFNITRGSPTGTFYRCYCKADTCLWNDSHTSGYHDLFIAHVNGGRPASSFKMKAFHPYYALTNNSDSPTSDQPSGAGGQAHQARSAEAQARLTRASATVTGLVEDAGTSQESAALAEALGVLFDLQLNR